MKIPDNYIKELVQGIGGDRAVNLVFLIKDKENVSEFKIADKMGITVNEVRNSLYRLQDKNIVYFTRKKDKKKGWYIYFWTFDMPRARDLMLEMKQSRKEELNKILREEKQGNIYVCPNKCVRITGEEALEHQFKCTECDSVLVEDNIEKRTDKIRKELEKLNLEIDELSKIQKPLPKVEPEKKIKKKPLLKKNIRKQFYRKKIPRRFEKPRKAMKAAVHKRIEKARHVVHEKPKAIPPQQKQGFLHTLKNKFSRRK